MGAVPVPLPPAARTAAVIGYGRVGRAHARHLRHVRPGMTVRVFSPLGIGEADEAVRAAPGFEEAVAGADSVMLCTPAADDVPDPRDLTAGAVVTSTNAPEAREIPPTAVPGLDVYVDAPTSLQVTTELVLATGSGWDPATVRGDPAGLVTGRAPRSTGERPVYFRSWGWASRTRPSPGPPTRTTTRQPGTALMKIRELRRAGSQRRAAQAGRVTTGSGRGCCGPGRCPGPERPSHRTPCTSSSASWPSPVPGPWWRRGSR